MRRLLAVLLGVVLGAIGGLGAGCSDAEDGRQTLRFGVGPLAGTLGVALHSWGSAAKLYADNIEEMPTGPLETARLTGAGWSKVVGHAVLPDATPGLFAVSLYVLEYNIRSSTVLGIVGAGGIGLELKNSVDLLNFPRMLTVLLVILIMVTAVDQLSSQLRRRIS